ncbi:uncharacterized protein LOC108903836 isoform X2 [Anoplophora glabripennis]|uniref:uncharacterized protein LOC108903836 isoform X2 n=1 Tax=Anoplophora glabripennis TaxID=217634 RepID=UPI000874CB13|nr:uncharacterized protein LOC108903836 isoform X2 [Anoplophora glabripennis]
MEEGAESSSANVPESPKPLAFTIDFGNNKAVDTQRQKALVEKLKNRHKRGQSLSKLEDSTATTTPPSAKQHPLTGNLPRKSSFQSEGYFSSDEKPDRAKTSKSNLKRSELTLFLKNVTSDRMTQSFPNPALPSISSPEEIELKDVSSPELDLISPFSPRDQSKTSTNSNVKKPQFSSPECEKMYIGDDDKDNVFVDGADVDFDKSDTASDTGTYTLDADNYSAEQKARMSIDKDFKIEQVSVQKKTEEYVKSLSTMRDHLLQNASTFVNKPISKETEVTQGVQVLNLLDSDNGLQSPRSPNVRKFDKLASIASQPKPSTGKVLSPIMSPTQNMSITQDAEEGKDKTLNNGECDVHNKTFTKIMFPSPKAKHNGLEQAFDHGSVISVTSSGAFKPKIEKKFERKYSLSKSEVQVQAYIDGKNYTDGIVEPVLEAEVKRNNPKLTVNIVNVQSIEVKKPNISLDSSGVVSANIVFEKVSNISPVSCQTSNLPPVVGGYSGKSSPTKIPSPIHTISRPRSRNSSNSMNIEFCDSNLDTDLILKPTQNYINSLQQRLSLDSDADSDYDAKYGIQLNNTAHLLKQKASHTRHNSLDDRTMNISNKLEHFQNKNLQGIDQTYTNLFNQYTQNKVIQKIQNSPNNSPIKRSSSFSTKNQIHSPKNTNVVLPQKESNICNSPNLTRNSSIQRSSSTVCIKPNYVSNRRPSVGDHRKSDRGQFGDTESSSEEDFEKNLQKRKDLANITNTRCNRAFSLRRARIDNEPAPVKCPNTPEMRRKTFHHEMKQERAISVDRKPMKTNDVQSRYLLNISKRGTPPPASKVEVKSVPKVGSATKSNPNRPQVFSRTDSGRFSMRTSSKPPLTNNTPKGLKKDGSGKKQGGARSNSSLSSREVEFQNWKRRKSYDPMKAAAEGKKKEIAKRQVMGQNVMTQSYIESNHSQDSSPSHSSSVHRSQVSPLLNNMVVGDF